MRPRRPARAQKLVPELTEEQVEAAIDDAHCELADCMPPQAMGQDWEATDIWWYAKSSLSDPHNKRHNWLVSRARLGSRRVHEALCDIALELTAGNEPLPLWLQRYVVGAARSGGERATPGHPTIHLVRDQVIAWAVHFISQRYKLHPTRNPATDAECGCSIVVRALKRLNMDLRLSTVADIWQRMGPFIERAPPVSILLPSQILLDNQAMLEAQLEAHSKMRYGGRNRRKRRTSTRACGSK